MSRRRTFITVSSIAACLVAVLAGCSSAPSGAGSAAGGDNNAPTAVALGEKDAGTTAGVAAGGTVTVTLQANPTTGYDWAVDGALPPQLQADGTPTFTSGDASGQVGAGGEVTMRFTAITRGTSDLKLKYWRSFEATTPPVKTWSATIDVK
jgi:inhibitor of cysteine peptidase